MSAARSIVLSTVCLLACTAAASAQSIGSDDFEGGIIGSLPLCPWLDAGLIDPTLPNPPSPSAVILATAGAGGRPTQSLHIVDSIAPSQGIYALVPVSSVYSVGADVRIERFSNNSRSATQDWPMQIGVGKLDGATDLAYTPQVGIYAASLTQGWRLYAVGAGYVATADVDLRIPAELDVWYRVQVDLTAATGEVRSRIWNLDTKTLLTDRVDVIPGWSPSDGIFDRLMVIDGETTPETTIANLATVDNVTFSAAPTIPPGPAGDLNGDGSVNAADLAILLGNWS